MSPFVIASAQPTPGATQEFKPAELISATPVPYPVNSAAWGLVVLQAIVKENGEIGKITPLREIQSLTSAAVTTVKTWRFQPATLADKPIRSRVEIIVMFNPFTKPSAVQLPPLSTTADDDPRNLNLPPEPPDVLSASSAVNPLYSTAVLWPGVVLQVRVGGGGEIEGLKAIKDVPPFTGAAQDALKEWLFAAPRYNGKFIAAPIFIDFSFPAATGQ